MKIRNQKIVSLLLAVVMMLPSLFAMQSCTVQAAETAGAAKTGTVVYAKTEIPDYSDYASAAYIEKQMKATGAYAIASKGKQFYMNGAFHPTAEEALMSNNFQTVKVNGSAVAKAFGISANGMTDSMDPADVAKNLGMEYILYDYKLIIFYTGEAPFHVFDDFYTLEAFSLMLKGASETELKNAFLDLPQLVSNNATNTVFYSDPNLNLGIQTAMYETTLGNNPNVATGPALVAGEGEHAKNHTVVRVFNRQQTCTAQFLAYPADVMGGVKVAAVQTGAETLIATAAFDVSSGKAYDVRVFDTFGSLRASIVPEFKGSYTIAAGNFLSAYPSELLLVANTAPIDGKLYLAFYQAETGALVKQITLDAAFAGTGKIQVTVRENATGVDTLILYFAGVNAVFEGSAENNTFTWCDIQLPSNVTGVFASANEGERFMVTTTELESLSEQSFVRVYGYENGTDGESVDVGLRENMFYSSHAENVNQGYIDHASFAHIRTDISGYSLLNQATSAGTDAKLEEVFENSTYNQYVSSYGSSYAKGLENKSYHLEPTFTHRWNVSAFTSRMMKYMDPASGQMLYSAIGKNGENRNYEELGAQFLNATYADGILELAKIRLFPMRSFLQTVAGAIRGENGNPGNFVGISPVHEQEINVADSVGDYNVKMVEGFRSFLLNLYGSVENINERFGTNFAAEADIDAPRNGNRGKWDRYTGDYFTQWCLYTRTIVNKRILEAYRETLMAGIPPECISSHQIPEGEAVSGFLGQADTRMSPIDVVMSAGTAFGATRYGNFSGDSLNFLRFANLAGHNNIVLGEYASLQSNYRLAARQIEYMWQNGLRMLAITNMTAEVRITETEAMHSFQKNHNEPRPGYAGGTTSVVSVEQAGKNYNIIQIGYGEGKEGLLKSVDENGEWEGTVYLVPFHSHVNIVKIDSLNGTASEVNTTGVIKNLAHSDQVEITFAAKGSGKVKIDVYNGGYLMEEASETFDLTGNLTPYRYVFANQLNPEGIEIKITFEDKSAVVEKMQGTIQTECVGRKYFKASASAIKDSIANYAGVTFDVLTPDMKG